MFIRDHIKLDFMLDLFLIKQKSLMLYFNLQKK